MDLRLKRPVSPSLSGRARLLNHRASVKGVFDIRDAVELTVVSIDRRWRDFGVSSVLVRIRLADEMETTVRLTARDTFLGDLKISLP